MHEMLTTPLASSPTVPDAQPAGPATIAIVAASAVRSAANALSEMALRDPLVGATSASEAVPA